MNAAQKLGVFSNIAGHIVMQRSDKSLEKVYLLIDMICGRYGKLAEFKEVFISRIIGDSRYDVIWADEDKPVHEKCADLSIEWGNVTAIFIVEQKDIILSIALLLDLGIMNHDQAIVVGCEHTLDGYVPVASINSASFKDLLTMSLAVWPNMNDGRYVLLPKGSVVVDPLAIEGFKSDIAESFEAMLSGLMRRISAFTSEQEKHFIPVPALSGDDLDIILGNIAEKSYAEEGQVVFLDINPGGAIEVSDVAMAVSDICGHYNYKVVRCVDDLVGIETISYIFVRIPNIPSLGEYVIPEICRRLSAWSGEKSNIYIYQQGKMPKNVTRCEQ